MATRVFLVTEDDRRLIKELLNRVGHMPISGQLSSVPTEIINGSPETYVVLPPAEGLPAATDPTHPGRARCSVFQLIEEGVVDGELVYTLNATGVNQDVNNLGDTLLAGDAFRLAVRDKYGSWYVVYQASLGGTVGTGSGSAGNGDDEEPPIDSGDIAGPGLIAIDGKLQINTAAINGPTFSVVTDAYITQNSCKLTLHKTVRKYRFKVTTIGLFVGLEQVGVNILAQTLDIPCCCPDAPLPPPPPWPEHLCLEVGEPTVPPTWPEHLCLEIS